MDAEQEDKLDVRLYVLEQEMKYIKNTFSGLIAGGAFMGIFYVLTDIGMEATIASIIAIIVSILCVANFGWELGRVARSAPTGSGTGSAAPQR